MTAECNIYLAGSHMFILFYLAGVYIRLLYIYIRLLYIYISLTYASIINSSHVCSKATHILYTLYIFGYV